MAVNRTGTDGTAPRSNQFMKQGHTDAGLYGVARDLPGDHLAMNKPKDINPRTGA